MNTDNAKMTVEDHGSGGPRSTLTDRIKPLKVDPGFVPCPVQDGDELFANGIFEFNITRLIEYVERNPAEVALVEVEVSDIGQAFSRLDESAVVSADIARPVVLAEISPGHFNVIDGNHRVEKARRHGVDTIRAHKLTAAEHVRFLTSRKAYLIYIDYWNGKAKGFRKTRKAADQPIPHR